jgi:hypothetical protein
MDHWQILTQSSDSFAILGYIPQIIFAGDPRPVHEQINDRYAHGGGFKPMKGWSFDPKTHYLRYPGDPAYRPLARAEINDEMVYVYPHAWVCVVASDGTFEVSRMD